MWRRDKGFRVGTTRTRPSGQHPQAHGLQIRSAQEHADAAWVLSTHETEGAGARRGAALRAAVRHSDAAVRRASRGERQRPRSRPGADRQRVRRASTRTRTACGCCENRNLDFKCPHHVPLSFEGRRRNVTLTLVRRSSRSRPMHTVAVGGRDDESRERLVAAGFSVRPAKRGSQSWRYESCFADFGRAVDAVDRIRTAIPGVASGPSPRLGGTKSLAFMPAASVRPGWSCSREDGDFDVVESRRARPARPAGLRPQRRGHPQLRRRRARHPQLDLRLPRRGHQEHPRISRTIIRTPTS